jgi:outer membrane lipopolysaccharide assembly protein LptE/RlpB
VNRLIINIFTVVFCVFFITACGYKIRGQVVLPVGIEAIHLVGASNDLSRAFEKALRFSSAALVKKATYTSVTIKIIEDRFKRRTASLTQRGKSTEFEPIYCVMKFMTGKGGC